MQLKNKIRWVLVLLLSVVFLTGSTLAQRLSSARASRVSNRSGHHTVRHSSGSSHHNHHRSRHHYSGHHSLGRSHHRGHHGHGHHRYGYYFYYGAPYYYYGYPRYRYYSRPYVRYNYYPEDYYKSYPEKEGLDSGYGKERKSGQLDTFEDVRKKLQRERAATAERIQRQLDHIAQAFANGDYNQAVLRVEQALAAEPDNATLEMVYSQSLFATGEYEKAAGVLRKALSAADVDKGILFTGSDFYPETDALISQITRLEEIAVAAPGNTDLQLVLGYELAGIGEYARALEALEKAKYDYLNRAAAEMIINAVMEARKDQKNYTSAG